MGEVALTSVIPGNDSIRVMGVSETPSLAPSPPTAQPVLITPPPHRLQHGGPVYDSLHSTVPE